MEEVAQEFEWYADWAADVSPLYERLARGTAEIPELLAMAAAGREGQPAPQLLLGAVHALLLEGRDHPLAAFYPTCTAEPKDPAAEDPFPVFREFCLAHEARLREIVRSRRVQTNEVGRSAVLLPAFEYVTRRVDREALALVEIGASAGLNLWWDRFRYEYAGHGTYGIRDAPVTIASRVQGEAAPPLPESLPEVVHRVGNDLHPLDVTDPEDARWLRALVVPDQQRRHERLQAAIEQVRADAPPLVAGDARELLPELIAEAPPEAACCVFSTLTLYQLGEEGVADLRKALVECSHERPIHWLSGDPAVEREGLTYRYMRLADGTTAQTPLAEYESYGAWIRWLADRTPTRSGLKPSGK